MSSSSSSYPAHLEQSFWTSSVDDFSYKRTDKEKGNLVLTLSTAVTGRKTWKTLKEKKEAVWPPRLEVALLEALEKYRPASSRDVRQLQRFPKRNRFISDYIFQATGRRRTAKQVGSRLQQLRDTCCEDRILDLLTRRDTLPGPDELNAGDAVWDRINQPHLVGLYEDDALPVSSATSSSASPAPFLSRDCPGEFILSADGDDIGSHSIPPMAPPSQPISSTTSPQACVYIELIPARTLSSAPHDCSVPGLQPSFCLDFDGPGDTMNPRPTFSSHTPLQNSTCISIITPDPLWDFIPTVSFTCPHLLSPQDYRCLFSVFLGDMHVHSEATELFQMPSPSKNGEIGPFVYGTKLIPESWATLCKNTGQDFSRCTVAQDIIRIPVPYNSAVRDGVMTAESVVFSVVYKFKHIQPIPPPPVGNFIAYQLPVLPEEPQLPPDFPKVAVETPYRIRTENHPGGWCSSDYSLQPMEEFSSMTWVYSDHTTGYDLNTIPHAPQPEFVPLRAPVPSYPSSVPMTSESEFAQGLLYSPLSHYN